MYKKKGLHMEDFLIDDISLYLKSILTPQTAEAISNIRRVAEQIEYEELDDELQNHIDGLDDFHDTQSLTVIYIIKKHIVKMLFKFGIYLTLEEAIKISTEDFSSVLLGFTSLSKIDASKCMRLLDIIDLKNHDDGEYSDDDIIILIFKNLTNDTISISTLNEIFIDIKDNLLDTIEELLTSNISKGMVVVDETNSNINSRESIRLRQELGDLFSYLGSATMDSRITDIIISKEYRTYFVTDYKIVLSEVWKNIKLRKFDNNHEELIGYVKFRLPILLSIYYLIDKDSYFTDTMLSLNDRVDVDKDFISIAKITNDKLKDSGFYNLLHEVEDE